MIKTKILLIIIIFFLVSASSIATDFNNYINETYDIPYSQSAGYKMGFLITMKIDGVITTVGVSNYSNATILQLRNGTTKAVIHNYSIINNIATLNYDVVKNVQYYIVVTANTTWTDFYLGAGDNSPYVNYALNFTNGIYLDSSDTIYDYNANNIKNITISDITYFKPYTNPTYQSSISAVTSNNISITFLNISKTNLTVLLNYGGNIYSPNYNYSLVSSNESRYDFVFNISNVNVGTNINFYFKYNYTNNTYELSGNTENYTQLTSYAIDNCSNNAYHILDVRFYKEDNPLENTSVYYEVAGGYAGSYNFSITGNYYNFSICTNNNYSITLDELYIKYNYGEITNKYYYYDETFSVSNPYQLNAYILNTTTDISELHGIVRNSNTYDYLSQVYMKLYRYYGIDNTWRLVQMDKSDVYGQVYFNVRENTYDYYLLFKYLGYDIYNTGTIKFICTSGICSLTFSVSPYESSAASVYMNPTYLYNNNTGIITISWDDSTDSIKNVIIDVSVLSPGMNRICYLNTTNQTGQYACNISGHYGTIFVTAKEYGSLDTFISEYIVRTISSLRDIPTFDKEDATFWVGGILATLTIAGTLISPVLAIVFPIFGLIVVSYLQFNAMITIAFIIPACIIGIIISILMRNG